MAEPKTVKLRTPIPWGKDTIDSITLRPITGKDMRRLTGPTAIDTQMELAARLSDQPSGVIDRLVGEDLFEVLEAVDSFMERSRPTGTEPSGS